jgi:hypothetical protein
MLVAVSPYHLTTREPAGLAAMLLADRVVTLLPASSRATAEQAAERSAGYLDFVLSWEWSVPLWEAGTIVSVVDGEDPGADVRAAHARISSEGRFSGLRSLMRPELLESEEAYLDAVAKDLLKGGPDPAITVPLAAGLDRFALRRGAAVARSHPSSVVQLAESRLGARAFAFAAPVLLQASAARILAAREALEPELTELRGAIDAMTDPALRTNGHAATDPAERLEAAASAYARAFDQMREDLLDSGADEPRVIDGVVAVTGLLMPADAVLTSSLAALRRMGGRGAGAETAEPTPSPGALGHVRFLALMFKVMGRVAAGRR